MQVVRYVSDPAEGLLTVDLDLDCWLARSKWRLATGCEQTPACRYSGCSVSACASLDVMPHLKTLSVIPPHFPFSVRGHSEVTATAPPCHSAAHATVTAEGFKAITSTTIPELPGHLCHQYQIIVLVNKADLWGLTKMTQGAGLGRKVQRLS